MALNRFSGDARVVVDRASDIARELGCSTVEAEHLLLAATSGESPAARVLQDESLDFDGVASALAAEIERSLAAVGISAGPLHFTPEPTRPRYATSAVVALERMLKVAVARGEKYMTTGHLVIGVLSAERGTVPRALECAGVDRDALARRVAATL